MGSTSYDAIQYHPCPMIEKNTAGWRYENAGTGFLWSSFYIMRGHSGNVSVFYQI
jgi:hypothetical protein